MDIYLSLDFYFDIPWIGGYNDSISCVLTINVIWSSLHHTIGEKKNWTPKNFSKISLGKQPVLLTFSGQR